MSSVTSASTTAHRIPVLDKGYVRLVDTMGEDLSIVNDAKTSFDREADTLGNREERLLRFLWRNEHTSPYRGSILKFEVYAPLLTARQWWKYVIGSDHQEAGGDVDRFLQWNESSRRYITEQPEFYVVRPDGWRSAPENRKQGSGPVLPLLRGERLTSRLRERIAQGLKDYEDALDQGVAPEQARLFLPAYGLYVRWRWTSSLNGVLHFLSQRLAHDAQKEIQDYAKAVRELTRERFPVAVKTWEATD